MIRVGNAEISGLTEIAIYIISGVLMVLTLNIIPEVIWQFVGFLTTAFLVFIVYIYLVSWVYVKVRGGR